MAWIQMFFNVVLANTMIQSPFENFSTPTNVGCINRCLAVPWCHAVSHSRSTQTCRLTDVRYDTSDTVNLATVAGWNYYLMIPDLCPLPYDLIRFPVHLCVKPSTIRLKYNEAKLNCQGDGGRLVKLETAEKNLALKEFLNSKSTSQNLYYIGIENETSATSFNWSDGTPGNYTNWKDREPSRATEKYGGIYKAADYQWLDLAGTFTEHFICEIPLNYDWL